MNGKRAAVSFLTALVISLSGMGVADAAPYNCKATRSGGAVVGTCKSGKGSFRIRANCANQPDRNSPWTKPGQYASISCSINYGPFRLHSYTFEVRD